ncbi:zinc finger protein 260-like [Polypterus senegalus]|uniref:zinc finger protein 260-like n=1 Tax=Polypterus senegalus TaxID=55291 RepID=UPI0019662F7E|nr:zinc finger protein 260-like [Polypterus senegalus]
MSNMENIAHQGPQYVNYKCEEVISEEVCNGWQETNPTLHWGLLLMNGIEVDEEHCIWRSGHLEQESVCMKKEEDCDSGPMDLTVDPAVMYYFSDAQKIKTENSVKVEDLRGEYDFQCFSPEEKDPGLGLTQSGYCSLQHHSVHVKPESDGKRTDEASGSNPSGEDLQDNGSFFLSLLAQTSLPCRSQQKMNNGNMTKVTSGLESVTPASLQEDPLLTMKPITSKPQMHFSNSATVPPMKSLKSTFQSRGGNLTQTQPKVYQCSECDKQFPGMGTLQIHTRFHTLVKPYCCSECGKRFFWLSSLQIHSRIHTEEKSYCCSECGKKVFASSTHLEIHRRVHTEFFPCCCCDCGKLYSQKGALPIHTTGNSAEKPYCCSEYGRFKWFNNLKAHKRIHNVEKPYCCSECGRRFTQLNNLENHKRIHNVEKPYVCPECDKRFISATNLRIHRTIHTKETLHYSSGHRK